MDCFNTFEGIAEASVAYCEWTDSQTPDARDDAKSFVTADSWLNAAQVGAEQLGGTFVGAEKLNTDAQTCKRIWDFSVLPALAGGHAVMDGHSSDLSKTAEIVACIGSTAGVLLYGDALNYPDNTTESAEYVVLHLTRVRGWR
ncbi:MAG: hypothetical protein LBU32_19565 [Clostridiales bacterium]|jgi:multiple sugar transport system substrate-binding protein|nr:hypothetical protein [Clostridiales bacterium]